MCGSRGGSQDLEPSNYYASREYSIHPHLVKEGEDESVGRIRGKDSGSRKIQHYKSQVWYVASAGSLSLSLHRA